jgi:hypothetical protein
MILERRTAAAKSQDAASTKEKLHFPAGDGMGFVFPS